MGIVIPCSMILRFEGDEPYFFDYVVRNVSLQVVDERGLMARRQRTNARICNTVFPKEGVIACHYNLGVRKIIAKWIEAAADPTTGLWHPTNA